MSQPLHATAVACRGPAGWRAVLLAGPPGAGKSDLALRLLARGWRLVGDDYVHVFASDGRLFAAQAPRIAGLIEARGVGLAPASALRQARIGLRVELISGPVERLPEPETWTFDGVRIPLLRLDPFHASAVEKVAAGLVRL